MSEDNNDDLFDFGLSGLSTQFHQDVEETPLEVARLWATGDARRLRDDAVRLLQHPVPDWALTALWRAASSMVGMDGIRTWLQDVETLCAAELLADGPTLEAPRSEVLPQGLTDAVLDELHLIGPALANATTSHPYAAVPDVVPALEITIRDVDPNLGFRMLLRCLSRYWIPLDHASYDRYTNLGRQFSLGEYVVGACDFLLKLPD
ncbi:hypothetical protein ACFXI0_32825 [Kitasatospora indigofera]|uniref:hypothetical protein n=1 Tax=Kitasatospora indigofera TaxID=67307 RepID=UPI003682E420